MNKDAQSSLKSAVARVSLHTALLTIIVVVLGIGAYYSVARVSAINAIQRELTDNISTHVEQILPSFLLLEQKSALPRQLERIQNQKNLSRVTVIEYSADIPTNFKDCMPSSEPVLCSAKDGSEVGILTPIMAGEQNYGYLFEAKTVSGSYAYQTIIAVALASILIISLFEFILFSLFHTIIGKKLPHDISSLLKYVRDLLHETPDIQKQPLEFSDFSALREDISEIFNNYKRTQNQAIVGHFATGVLHDIKTQLQSIVAASELAEEAKSDKRKYEDRLANLQHVLQKNLPDLQSIIKSTLDANKEISLSLQKLNIEDTIKSSIEYAKVNNQFGIVELNFENSEKTLLLNHDRAQVMRLFYNLIKNAIEAQNKIGNKSAKKVLVRIQDLKEKVLLRVEDSGPGFKVAVSEIFDPFVTTKKYGIGFGLYNAQKVVNAHGWKIAASISEDLGGACFEITIPKEVNI